MGSRFFTPTILALAFVAVSLAGCTDEGSSFDFRPGTKFSETGNTVNLKMSVADNLMREIFPGFFANVWAFCAEAADPNDQYSKDAIEHWNVLDTDGNIDGATTDPASCSVPGPVLRVQQGDRVIVEFGHNHFHCHTIHWHGQFVPWKSDGVPGATQDSTCPGESFTYDFIAARAGSLWYHCHVDTHFHVMQGLYGVIIVEPQDTKYEPKDIDQEYIFVYGSMNREMIQVDRRTYADPHINHKHGAGCGASGVPSCQNPSADTDPDTWTLNGRSAPYTMMDRDKSVIIVEEGERVRVRLYNVGETMETIHTHGHDMYVTHRDGNPLNPEARFWVDTLTIGPAERYDVVLEMDNPGLWMMHSHIDGHVTNDGEAPGGGMSMIAYKSALAETGDVLKPFAAEDTGGKPLIDPLDIPVDVLKGAVIGQQGPNASGTLSFEWEMPCATRQVFFSATSTADVSLLQTTHDIDVEVTTPSGDTFASFSLGADRNGEWTRQWSQGLADGTDTDGFLSDEIGTYTISVSGTTSPGDIELTVRIVHFQNEDEVFDTNLPVKNSGTICDPANREWLPGE